MAVGDILDEAIGPSADDVDLVASSKRSAQKLNLDIRAACESGWDFSSRWFDDEETLAAAVVSAPTAAEPASGLLILFGLCTHSTRNMYQKDVGLCTHST